jgi:hypothetical protein
MTGTIQIRHCECGRWTSPTESTGCTAEVKLKFQQGHDAKLRELFVKAALRGEKVTRDDLDYDPIEASGYYGFQAQVVEGVERGRRQA